MIGKNAIFAASFRVGTLPYFWVNVLNHTRTKQISMEIIFVLYQTEQPIHVYSNSNLNSKVYRKNEYFYSNHVHTFGTK